MVHAKNQTKILGGQITLYQRDDLKDATWHMRVRIEGHKGYVRRATRETSLAKATDKALLIYGELNERKAQSIPLQKKNFAEIADSFAREAKSRMEEGRSSAGRYEIVVGTLNRYLLPYFGKMDINYIQPKDMLAYRQWRLNYYITGPGKKKKTVLKVKPSQATLRMEWTILRGVFKHGVEMRQVNPSVLAMIKPEPTKTTKRSAFTTDEWKALQAFMPGWVASAKTVHGMRQRQLIRDYVMIMANSGMRKGEARHLKWRDYRIHITEHGRWPILHVKGKTGERDVVCQPGVEVYLESQRNRGYHDQPDDFIFCHEDGKAIKHLRGFTHLLSSAKMALDAQQRKRTIYCLRHTYATQRLENGANVYWLKQNMGTSVAMIEKHYGQTQVLVGIEHETAQRKMPAKPAPAPVPITITATPSETDIGLATSIRPDIWGTSISTANPAPLGLVDITPVANLIDIQVTAASSSIANASDEVLADEFDDEEEGGGGEEE